MKKGFSRFKLVYAITIHHDLGNTIEAFKIRLNADDSFSMTFSKITSQSINEEEYEVSAVDQEIIGLISEYTENAIVDQFSKKNRYFHAFLEKEWTDELYEKKIRPFIERRLVQVIKLILKNNIPLYYKGDKNEFFNETPVRNDSKPAEVFFNFDRKEEEIQYFINIHQGDHQISLLEKRFCILTYKPSYVLIDNDLLSFRGTVNSRKILPFFTKEYVSVVKSFEPKYFNSFIKATVAEQENVHCIGFDLEEIEETPIAVLGIDLDIDTNPVILLSFRYGSDVFGADNDKPAHVDVINKGDNYKLIKTKRNTKQEDQYRKFLKSLGLVSKGKYTFVPKDQPAEVPEDMVSWLNKYADELAEKNFEIKREFKKKTYFTGKTELVIEVKDKIDWFDVLATARFGDFVVPLVKLRKHIMYGKRAYLLPDGSIGVIPEEWITSTKELLMFSKTEKDNLRVERSHAHLLKPEGKESPVDLKKKLTDYHQDDKPAVAVPKNLNATLRGYQSKGLDWFYYLTKNKLGCCLADDMGLGKTLQALAILLKYKEETEVQADETNTVQLDLFNRNQLSEFRKPALVVVPTSLIFNWVNEIHKFAPSLMYHVHSGYKRSQTSKQFHLFDLIITTYGTLRNDLNLFKSQPLSYVVLDESQNIKNPASKIFKAVISLDAEFNIALTGTPIENSLSDLWAQMSFLNPGLLGEFAWFKNNFQLPIEKNSDEVRKEKLKKLIQPFVLRRTKGEVAKELPELSENIRFCEMTDKQKKIYDKRKSLVRNSLYKSVESFDPKGQMITVLRGLMQLRQLANHPLLLDENWNERESGKYVEVIESLENIISEGHKVLVFSAFEKLLLIFKNYFEKKGTGYAFMSGKVIGSKRKQVVESFQNNPRTSVLLATLKTGGVGLNLTAAEYVFVVDPWWNPASELQAINRAHRIGQNKNVFAYRFITRESIEEKILMLQDKKKMLASDFINNNNPLRNMQPNEIVELFE